MAECPRCKTKWDCACQLKEASDKVIVCEECIENYELKLKIQKRDES